MPQTSWGPSSWRGVAEPRFSRASGVGTSATGAESEIYAGELSGESHQGHGITFPWYGSSHGFAQQIHNVITHYHFRAWRVESAAYVDWEGTSVTTPYSGGGTLVPPNGKICWTWTS